MPESEHNPDRRGTTLHATVTGVYQDADQHWVVQLSCGHTQHLRHQPPWQSRAWVNDPAQRLEKIGHAFACGWCAQERE